MDTAPRQVWAWLTDSYQGIPGVTKYSERGWAGIRAIGVHVQDGSSHGTQIHFRSPGVSASSTVLINKDGTIVWLVPEAKAPWTNGDVMGPDSQVLALMAKYGPDPNRWMLTIEMEGFSGGLPYTEAQYQSLLWLIREWRKKYGPIPVLAHRQINSVTRAGCPERPGGRLLPRMYADLSSSPGVPTPLPKPAAAFDLGDTVRFTEALNVRRAWSLDEEYQGKPNVIATLPAGTIARIIAGPNYNDDYNWWDIAIDKWGTGHVAEDWLEEIAAPPVVTPIPVNKTFTVRFDVPIRPEPGFSAPILRELPAGTKGEVIADIDTVDGIKWAKVKTGGDTGWVQMTILQTIAIEDAA